ncbi:hypothetical protein CO641_00765 [Lysobacteraceae bacterium NML91-0213]|nr:hypothetical protein CO641_00765 [Xanthomonadaceae bacterium NML91-0213]
MNAISELNLQVHPFDARGVGRRFRHVALFGALDALQPGEGMRFINDHDPLPLLAQLRERYGKQLAVDYVQRQPGEVVIDFTVLRAPVHGEGSECCGGCS